jgi:DNA repair exonuclease SbcCD ATPase subunit
MNTLKLRPLLENFQPNVPAQEPKKEWTTEAKKEALMKIAEYNKYSESLYRPKSLMEVSHELSEIAQLAKELALHETQMAEQGGQDWFNKKIVERNFGTIDKTIAELSKLSKEAHLVEQQIQACYEDIGNLLERYYEVKNLQEGQASSCKI